MRVLVKPEANRVLWLHVRVSFCSIRESLPFCAGLTSRSEGMAGMAVQETTRPFKQRLHVLMLRLVRCGCCDCSAYRLTAALTYSGGQIGAQEAALRRLVSQPADGPEPEIDCAWGEMTGLQMHTVADDYRLAERQSWLGAVPVHELVNGMAIPSGLHRHRFIFQPTTLAQGPSRA